MNYKKVYCKFFCYGIDEDEFIPSEISGKKANSIHHIYSKQMSGKKSFLRHGKVYLMDCIENLIAVTRDEHKAIHNENYDKDELWILHQRTIKNHLNVSKSNMKIGK